MRISSLSYRHCFFHESALRRPALRSASSLLAAVAILVAAGCNAPPEARKIVPPPVMDGESVRFSADNPQIKVLHSVEVQEQNREIIRLPARVVWDETRTVRIVAPLSGRITRLLAQPGDFVKAGTPLAIMASPDLGQAQAEARRATVDLGLAEKNLARARELHEHGVIAMKELQQAQAEHGRAEAERQRAGARLKIYGSSDAMDQDYAIRAPISGVVIERNANTGQEVRPDQSSGGAMFVLSDPTHLWVQIDVNESALRVLKIGEPMTLGSPSLGELTFKARVEQIADFFDPQTRTVRVRASVDNPGRKLKADMFVSAEIEIDRGKFIQVPAPAIMLRGETQYVFVDEGEGRYRRQKVIAEEAGFGQMRVRTGLKTGDRVVLDGGLLLMQLFGRSRG
jgi:cobalt-zinc-cadmium efflux system membrane fusion protein